MKLKLACADFTFPLLPHEVPEWRSVRFRTEAFWGMANDIIVVASERGTIEVAVKPGDAEPVAARLDELLRPAG